MGLDPARAAVPALGQRLFGHRPAVAGLAEFGRTGREFVDLTAGTLSLAAQTSNETARRFALDRFTILALKGPIAEFFQIKVVAQGQDSIDQMTVLALPVDCLAAFNVGDAGLGLLHPAGLIRGPGADCRLAQSPGRWSACR